MVETFVLAVGGESGPIGPAPNFQCSTFTAPAPVLHFFGSHPPSLPTAGLSTCHIAGGFRTTTAAAAPLSDATALNTTFNIGTDNNMFSGSASATAQYGAVGAQAHGEFSGPVNTFIVRGAEGYGLFQETGLLPNTHADTITFQFTVEGSLSVHSPVFAPSDVEVRYQLDTGPIFTLMRAQVDDALSQPLISVATAFGTQFGPGVFGGFTLAPGSVSGSGVFETFALPIVPGTPFDFRFGLLASTIPGPGAMSDADFLTRAWLTGIQLSAGGQPVTHFLITSDSGTVYGPTGVHVPVTAVPEPATLLLLSVGVLGMGLWRRQGGPKRTRSAPLSRA